MILLQIKNYLTEKKCVSLPQLALQFRQSPQAMQHLMKHWLRKGKVKKIKNPPGCGSRCTQCDPEWAEEYIWLDGHS